MKIRIEHDSYRTFITDLRARVLKKEFPTWKLVYSEPDANGKSYGRIVHIGDGNQYDMIQICFYGPKKEDIAQGVSFVELEPKAKAGSKLSPEEIQAKSAVVMGRLCELIIAHCSDVVEFKVYTK